MVTNKRSIVGITLVVLGLFFLLRSLNIIWFDFDEVVWRLFPLGLVALGAYLIIKRKRRAESGSDELPTDFTTHPDQSADRQSGSDQGFQKEAGFQKQARVSSAPDSTEGGKIRFTQLIGELYVDCAGLSLKNVEVSGFIGEIEVTIHGGILQPGLNRIIISNFIGEIRILVPKGMPTFVHCSNFIGDIDVFGKRTSGFGNHIEGQTPDYTAAGDKLFLAISSFIADIRVYTV